MLVVCHGNICRSPYAAAILARAVAGHELDGLRVDSAGFIGPGRRPPGEARAVAKRRGIDMSDHVSKVVTPDVIRASDLVVVMDPRQRQAIEERFEPPHGSVVLLGDFDPKPIRRRAVLDPINQPEAMFDAVYGRIDRCVRTLADAIGARTGSTR